MPTRRGDSGLEIASVEAPTPPGRGPGKPPSALARDVAALKVRERIHVPDAASDPVDGKTRAAVASMASRMGKLLGRRIVVRRSKDPSRPGFFVERQAKKNSD